jgi:hypothetical protein
VRFWVIGLAGVLATVAGLANLAGAVAVWASPPTCFPAQPGGHVVCLRTGPASGLPSSPWTYLAIGSGLLMLGGCLFGLAGVRRGPIARTLGWLRHRANSRTLDNSA